MEIQNTNNTTTNSTPKSSSVKSFPTFGSNFASELETAKEEKDSVKESKETKSENSKDTKKTKKAEEKKTDKKVDNAIDDLKDTIDEVSTKQKIKEKGIMIDNNNNMNFQELANKFNLDMNFGKNMNFNNSSEQSFSAFIKQQNSENKLDINDSSEENAVLSAMEENIAMANRNMLLNNEKTTILVQNEKGIKKVDSNTHITIENIVSYDNIIMDRADVEFFVNLVDKGTINFTEVQNAQKSSHVSKTLADLLAKSMNENKPIRIDFDNDISIIIKVSRQGKISADFLPSSQVAEAYLKENLPLLKQRFDEKNIEYDELNQRKQKQDTQDNNRKKGSKNE